MNEMCDAYLYEMVNSRNPYLNQQPNLNGDIRYLGIKSTIRI